MARTACGQQQISLTMRPQLLKTIFHVGRLGHHNGQFSVAIQACNIIANKS